MVTTSTTWKKCSRSSEHLQSSESSDSFYFITVETNVGKVQFVKERKRQ